MYKAGCLSLVDIIEDIKIISKKQSSACAFFNIDWVTICLETSNKALIPKAHKDYVPICMECLNDGTPEVRDAAFSALTALEKVIFSVFLRNSAVGVEIG